MVRRPGHHGSPVELARPLWPRAFARQTPDHCTQPNVHRRLTRSRTPQIFRTRTEAREKLSPLAACWTTELGGLNKFIHTWVYKDLNERGRIGEEIPTTRGCVAAAGRGAADPAGKQAADSGALLTRAVVHFGAAIKVSLGA
jgi:NIPSNAP